MATTIAGADLDLSVRIPAEWELRACFGWHGRFIPMTEQERYQKSQG
jgi:hypothetical protein